MVFKQFVNWPNQDLLLEAMANQTLQDLVSDFLDSKASDPDISTATHTQYAWALNGVFLPWTFKERITDPGAVDQKILNRYAAYLKTKPTRSGKPLSRVSVSTYVRGANVFFHWAAKQGEMAAVTAPGGTSQSRKNNPPIVLTREEMARLEAATTTPRDAVIVRILVESGMRLGELISLRLGDVVVESGRNYLRVRGKTGSRSIGISRELHRRIRAYITGGRPGETSDDSPLFMGLRRRPNGDYESLTASGVQQMIRHAGGDAKIRKRVHPNLLRHSFATDYLNATGDPVTLADQLGHSSLAMVQAVYTHLAADQRHAKMMEYLKKKAE
jgi:integrase/recombinase XerD